MYCIRQYNFIAERFSGLRCASIERCSVIICGKRCFWSVQCKLGLLTSAPCVKTCQQKGKEVTRPQSRPSATSASQAKPSEKSDSVLGSSDSLFSAPPSPDTPLKHQTLPEQEPKSKTAALPKLNIPTDSDLAQSATTPQLPSAGPSKPLPSHRDRQMNPRVQMMPMQVKDRSGTSLISTKQKIAERAGAPKLSPVVPSAPAPSATEGLFPQKSKSLANLSFKKKATTGAAPPTAPSTSFKKYDRILSFTKLSRSSNTSKQGAMILALRKISRIEYSSPGFALKLLTYKLATGESRRSKEFINAFMLIVLPQPGVP